MKATSVQNIKNVRDISCTIEKDSIVMESKVTIVATTNDDIFAFEFEGFDILHSCEKAGLFAGLENDRKIRELEKENNLLRKHLKDVEDKLETANKQLIKENEALKKDLALEKAANEAQHKFIREYAGKGTEVQFNYAIDDAKEVSYVVVEKNVELAEENKQLKQENSELKYMLNDIKFTKDLTEMCLNTRAGILDQAKKCVCGQREQDYGTPENNFQLIADLWNGYLFTSFLPIDKPVISATDVSMMMALLKIARIKNGGGSGDSFVDLAGYAACGGEIWALQKETN